jgi:ubiquinone/menaquinone biosynthesis C-methylase UbiE
MDPTAEGQSIAETVERERQFYNEKADRYRRLRMLIWRAIGEFNRNEDLHTLYDARGKRVLLYGCGPANDAKVYLDQGALQVTGIDISEAEIEEAERRALEEGYADRAEFMAADAHHTAFPDDSFDLIVGAAILHHLDLTIALAELRRILAPGGRAVFQEPLAHNPLIRLGRRLTPSARTDDEHPITVEDWRLCAEAFPGFTHREVELTSVPLMPLNLVIPTDWQRRLAGRVRTFDDRVLERYPALRPYARSTFLIFE